MTELDMTGVIKARKCPHFITITRAKTLASMCERCEVFGPPGIYGRFAKSGPTTRTRSAEPQEILDHLAELEDAA